MFGPALLVCPVTEYKARSRELYLPEGGWYNFWTGSFHKGGENVLMPAPLDEIPLFVREGSILPVGPEIEYTRQKPEDPLTLYVYSGKDASFAYYEDDGLTFEYEKGQFAVIPFQWDEGSHTLNIGKRLGGYEKMPVGRTIRVVLISPEKRVPFPETQSFDKVVTYDGNPVTLKF